MRSSDVTYFSAFHARTAFPLPHLHSLLSLSLPRLQPKPQMPQKHPLYYFEDGNITFLLTDCGILYRLYKGLLALDAGYFKTLLSLKPEHQEEGLDDSRPIEIPSTSQVDFDRFLNFLMWHQLPEDDLDVLISVLNLGYFFELEVAQVHAGAALESHPNFKPALQLSLGLKNTVKEWTEKGFRALVALPHSQLTEGEVDLLGLWPYHVLMRTKSEIMTHHQCVSFSPPAVVHHVLFCDGTAACEYAWRREWWNGVAKCLLYPDKSISDSEVLGMLVEVEILDMHVRCKEGTMQWILQKGVLTREEKIISRSLRSLLP
ncbi:hypothetical protein LXA43DRAFT_903519 [Ganoderma leucocontextum]|nr:hypothetical protein LXA43DRAFT_903519 [Ganoderma leucocontextum]